jgi:hypothetical protein
MSHNTERGVITFHRYTILLRSSLKLAMHVEFAKFSDSYVVSQHVLSSKTSVRTQFSWNYVVITPITAPVFIVLCRFKLVLEHVPITEQPHTPPPQNIFFIGTPVSQEMCRGFRPLQSSIGFYWKSAEAENVKDKQVQFYSFVAIWVHHTNPNI